MSIRRLQQELNELKAAPPEGCTADTATDDDPSYESQLSHWRATMTGPVGSPYEGGVFRLDIRFPSNYPFKPPEISFITTIYHCNIDSLGHIDLDTLDSPRAPKMTVAKVLAALRALLVTPNPEAPLNPEIAAQYLTDRAAHDETAAEWTRRYAI